MQLPIKRQQFNSSAAEDGVLIHGYPSFVHIAFAYGSTLCFCFLGSKAIFASITFGTKGSPELLLEATLLVVQAGVGECDTPSIL